MDRQANDPIHSVPSGRFPAVLCRKAGKRALADALGSVPEQTNALKAKDEALTDALRSASEENSARQADNKVLVAALKSVFIKFDGEYRHLRTPKCATGQFNNRVKGAIDPLHNHAVRPFEASSAMFLGEEDKTIRCSWGNPLPLMMP